MKPLNRPMFKYGGPIKEGIMSGMEDNRQAINTVGSPLAPKDETGRGGYAVPLIAGIGMGAARLAPIAMRGLTALRNLYSRQVPAQFSRVTPKTTGGGYMEYGGVLPSTTKFVRGGTGPVKGVGMTRELRPFIQRDPVLRTLFGAGKVGAKAAGPVKSLAKYSFTTPSGLALTGYGAGSYIYDKLKGEKTPKAQKEIEAAGGPPGGGDPNMFLEPKDTVVNQEKLDQMNKDRIQKTKDRYYKLMGLDNMKKDAVYDSLIDASKIIQQEGGDLKGAIKSGSLQTQIIDAISKQLDKSSALKKQIDAAVLKGEIEKDIKANDPAAKLAAEYTKKRIELTDKQLAGGDLSDVAAEYRKQGLSLKGQNLFAEASRKGINTVGILPTEKVDEFLVDNPTLTEADFVNLYQEQLVEAEKDKLPAGDYVVGGRIITIGEDGKAKAFVY